MFLFSSLGSRQIRMRFFSSSLHWQFDHMIWTNCHLPNNSPSTSGSFWACSIWSEPTVISQLFTFNVRCILGLLQIRWTNWQSSMERKIWWEMFLFLFNLITRKGLSIQITLSEGIHSMLHSKITHSGHGPAGEEEKTIFFQVSLPKLQPMTTYYWRVETHSGIHWHLHWYLSKVSCCCTAAGHPTYIDFWEDILLL